MCCTVWHSLTTTTWQNVLLENHHSITCFGILHPKSLLLSSENKLVFHFANQQKHVVLCWQNYGRNLKLFHLLLGYLFQHLHICISFAVCVEYTQTYLKARWQNCNVFRTMKMNSSLFLFVFEQRNIEIPLNRILF